MASIYRKSEIPDHLQRFFCPAEIGLEKTPEAFIAELVGVFREVKRVLRDDGVMWVNMGDSYAAGKSGRADSGDGGRFAGPRIEPVERKAPSGFKPKDLLGIPWMLAFALRADGWYLRQDIIWHKPAPMPESVRDRCTKAHEYIFLMTKSARYFYDSDAIAEPLLEASVIRNQSGWNGNEDRGYVNGPQNHMSKYLGSDAAKEASTRNARSVWTIGPSPFSQAHFATFPPALPERCIRAGTSEKGCCAVCGAPVVRVVERTKRYDHNTTANGKTMNGPYANQAQQGEHDIRHGVFSDAKTTGWKLSCDCNAATVPCRVLDPFFGAGTTGLVAQRMGRDCVGCELNDEYAEMARNRIYNDAPLLANVEAV